MKKIKFLKPFALIALFSLVIVSCEEEYEFGDVTAPSNLSVEANVLNTSADFPNGDGSGEVKFVANAEDAITYEFHYGDGTSETVSDGDVTYAFKQTGVNDYVVTVVAKGTGGTTTSQTIDVTVFSSFEDADTQAFLTGGSSKTWYVAAALPGHLGVGPVETATPDYYAAQPFEKESEGCFYNDELTFSEENGNITYVQENQGATFFNVDFLSVGGGAGPDDQCLGFDTSGEKVVNLAAASSNVPEDQTTGTQIIISGGGFMSYYIEPSGYEILEISEDYMYVRAIPGSNPALAWYLKFTTDPDGGGNGGGVEMLETEFPGDSAGEAFWSDEFEGSSLDTAIWNIETGNGDNGWGNGEAQYYLPDNITVSDGTLKITAKAESSNGFDYTSSRITTKDNFDFQYGRIEVRAKLPTAGGTWPAIWMLGNNFDQVGWPATGEIDIMEHVGNQVGEVLGTLHYPGNSGGNAVSQGTQVDDVTQFHNYTVEWTEDHIIFAIDNEIFHEFESMAGTPFVDHPFFVILNVAMGGTLGGNIDPAFTEDSMEIDYVRVYQ